MLAAAISGGLTGLLLGCTGFAVACVATGASANALSWLVIAVCTAKCLRRQAPGHW
jgi:hypothetical protein